jgi:threonine/homoserine/homoserine lactone efflux protein
MSYFLLTSALLALSPGPDNLYLLNLSLLKGKKAALIFTLGLCSGLVFHALVAAFGIGVIVAQNTQLFFALKLLGAFYLLYLAWVLLWIKKDAKNTCLQKTALGKLYIRGIFMNISNPKVLIFFIAFLPQFVTDSANFTREIIVLSLLFTLATFAVFATIVLLASSIKPLFYAPKFHKILDSVTALVFLFIAYRLIA